MSAVKRVAAIALFAACAAPAAAQGTASRLRVEYLDAPLTIDVAAPRFSFAPLHPARAAALAAYRIVVAQTFPAVAVAWDSSVVAANSSLNIAYKGAALVSNADYSWTVTWVDNNGTTSAPASSTFSTGLLSAAADWAPADWVSGGAAGELNTFRTELTLASPVTRARLYITALGYGKTYLNGVLTDDHELGQFTTFQQRTLYDVVDVAAQLRVGCNALGVMLGNGWWSEPSIKAGVRQFRLVLSVTMQDGTTSTFSSSNAGGAAGALVFAATAGPVTSDNIYDGETFDGRIAAALAGWNSCGFAPSPAQPWQATVAPAVTPSSYGAVISSHGVLINTDRTFAVVDSGITQPFVGTFVFDFGQNMAGQTTLKVEDCPNGTEITLIHNEILNPDGTVNRNLAKMEGRYICGGSNGMEDYRSLFTYYGFRYVQVNGYPGVPGEEALLAHFVHSDVPQSGEFSSSSPLLNAIQHATRFASWSNLMDVPTDCPQRERRGWLGDAQLSFETVIHNIDGGGFYTKWLNDFADTQVYDNRTMNSDGALPDCIPFYGHGHTDSDPGWGFAAWEITDKFSDYFADDVFDVQWYPNLKWYMDHWVKLANANGGMLNLFDWGDWANYVPGPYAFKTPEYPQFFYVRALEITTKFAKRLGQSADAAYYGGLATAARALYQSTYFNATTNCYAGCTYVSQVFALTLGLAGPQGSPTEQAVWANALDWWSANATHGVPEHFGGGIISLKYSLPLLDAHAATGLALKMHMQTDRAPGFGYWVETGGATTLWEEYDMTATEGTASRNHIMFGAAGSWYFSSIAGLDRAPNSRSYQNLVIRPPPAADIVYTDGNLSLTWATASIDSSMGLVSSSWTTKFSGSGAMCGSVGEDAALELSCEGGGVFTGVTFASFGTWTGSCAAGFSKGACDAATSVEVITKLCVGKSSCSIQASDSVFGDPCPSTVKKLAVSLAGQCGQPAGDPKFELKLVVPVGGAAQVIIPAWGTASSANVTDGAARVWSAGAFVPGTPGVMAGAASADGLSVELTVASGAYDFSVYQ
jgi:alpha-L-rhamnosidase